METWFHTQLYYSFHCSYEFFSTATRAKRKKWETNGAIGKSQRDIVYFVDPLELSEPLLAKIRNGDFVALHGARATGKSTRVLKVIDRLEEDGFSCIQ